MVSDKTEMDAEEMLLSGIRPGAPITEVLVAARLFCS